MIVLREALKRSAQPFKAFGIRNTAGLLKSFL